VGKSTGSSFNTTLWAPALVAIKVLEPGNEVAQSSFPLINLPDRHIPKTS
jgi:hypothetical protein